MVLAQPPDQSSGGPSGQGGVPSSSPRFFSRAAKEGRNDRFHTNSDSADESRSSSITCSSQAHGDGAVVTPNQRQRARGRRALSLGRLSRRRLRDRGDMSTLRS